MLAPINIILVFVTAGREWLNTEPVCTKTRTMDMGFWRYRRFLLGNTRRKRVYLRNEIGL